MNFKEAIASLRSTYNKLYFLEIVVPKNLTFEGRIQNSVFSIKQRKEQIEKISSGKTLI